MSHINLDLQASHKMLMLLDEANANTESVIDLIPGIFLVVNENHEVLRANFGFVELFGLDAEDIFRLPLAKFFRKESWKIFAHNIKQLFASQAPAPLLRFEMGLTINHLGKPVERPFHWTLSRRHAKAQGEGPLLSIFGDDISGMREAERRLSKIFTSIPLGIFTVNKDGRLGDSYSSYLESMLQHGKLAGAAVETVLFGPAMAAMAASEIAGVKAIQACLGQSELDYGAYARSFPHEIFHNTAKDPKDGRWLRITYQPIVFDRVVEQLLLILEDRTAIVNAEKEMLEVAREREMALALEKQSLALYESAIRDPLTGLYTRLYMKDAVATLLWEHDRHETLQVSMVIFDIDHFKKVNDGFGHQSGDLVLREVAQILLRLSRESDIPIRFGGEEFVVFMLADCAAALAYAEEVRQAVEAAVLDVDEASLRVTISGGVTAHRKDESLEDFMQRADQLLYLAKRQGRNRMLADSGQEDARLP
jgi:two-component system cell cycle response regulator